MKAFNLCSDFDMDIFEICAVAVLCAVVGAVIGKAVGGVSVAIRLGGLALVLGAAISLLGEVVESVRGLSFGGDFARYTEIMLKGLGIAALCRICSDVCRDCGENTVASAVESAGKLSMVILAMPMVAELAEYAVELIQKTQ